MATTLLDKVYTTFLTITLSSMLLVDLVHFYPTSIQSLLPPIREWYATTYNDPWIGSPEDSLPRWFRLFTLLELVLQLPLVAYLLAGYAKGGSTSGAMELAALVYGVQCALTTLVCVYDVPSWDAEVYSAEDKSRFMFQIYGPWVFVPTVMAVDMYWRLLQRVKSTNDIKRA